MATDWRVSASQFKQRARNGWDSQPVSVQWYVPASLFPTSVNEAATLSLAVTCPIRLSHRVCKSRVSNGVLGGTCTIRPQVGPSPHDCLFSHTLR